MRSVRRAVLFLSLMLASALTAGAAQVQRYVMTKPKPPSNCSEAVASPPLGYVSFSTGEASAYLWFYVTDMKAGDTVATEYYTPTGRLYSDVSGPFNPVSSDGNWCFTDTEFKINGALPASNPGEWRVAAKLNGTQLFELKFTIGNATVAVPTSGTPTTGTTTSSLPTTNLLRNPDAEGGGASDDCSGVPAISYWTTDGKMSVCRYGYGDYLARNSPGPTDRGTFFFAGGFSDRSSIYQVLDVSSYAALIDAGSVPYTLSGWLGGWSAQDDSAKLSAAFKDANGATLAYATIGPVLAAERNSVTGLFYKSATGTVPANTRRIDVDLAMTRVEGSANDGYADNVSFSFTRPSTSCAYSATLTSQVPAAGGTGTINVTTTAGCTWTAVSNAPWLTIASGASGAGSGTVTYRAAANTATSPRTGTITVAGFTHTVTQAAAVPTCTYSISPTTASVAAAGGSVSVAVTTASACNWTATGNVLWISVASGASGAGNGTVSLRVAANTATTARTGTATIAGQTFTVSQEAAAEQGPVPTIVKNGIIHTASYISAAQPAGAIARGGQFSIQGTDMGPAEAVQGAYPLTETLGGVSVRITQGSTSMNAWPFLVSATRIDAVMPSNAPLGEVQVTVTYRGQTSAAATIRVAKVNFGAFGTLRGKGPGVIRNINSDEDQPLNSRTASAKPGQKAVLAGTGLGAIDSADNVAPPAVQLPAEIFVGGKQATVTYSGRETCCAGLDRIEFEVPADAPLGCYIPVQVKADGLYSNTVTMAIEAEGQACKDNNNPFADLSQKGGKAGFLMLARGEVSLPLEADKPPTDMLLDLGAGAFQSYPAGGEESFNPLFAYPALGTCTTYSGSLDLSSLAGITPSSASATDTGGLTGASLDAGEKLTVTVPGGTSIDIPRTDEEATTGPYGALLGGVMPIGEEPMPPPVLNGGTYTIKGTGGKDVGAFSVNLEIPKPVTWTNRADITEVDRAAGVTLNWSGGSSSQFVLIGGASNDQTNEATSGFFCFVRAEQGTFTVPAQVLGTLPASIDSEGKPSIGALVVGTLPAPPYATFTATGLDSGLVLYLLLNGAAVPYK